MATYTVQEHIAIIKERMCFKGENKTKNTLTDNCVKKTHQHSLILNYSRSGAIKNNACTRGRQDTYPFTYSLT